MLGVLRVMQGPDQGRTFSLPRGQALVLGRDPRAAVHLEDPQVARIHCRIEVEDDLVVLTDVSGTLVNGARVTRHTLMPGDLIAVGETQLSFQWSDADEKQTDTWKPGSPR